MNVQTLIQVLEAEVILFRELAGLEQRMLLALLDHDSAKAQACQADYQTLCNHIAHAEEIRLSLIRKTAEEMGINPVLDEQSARVMTPQELFARLQQQLAPELAGLVKDGMKDFKRAVEELLSTNRALAAYTQAQLLTLDGFLAELMPARKNGLYGADGRQQSSVRPQLFSREM